MARSDPQERDPNTDICPITSPRISSEGDVSVHAPRQTATESPAALRHIVPGAAARAPRPRAKLHGELSVPTARPRAGPKTLAGGARGGAAQRARHARARAHVRGPRRGQWGHRRFATAKRLRPALRTPVPMLGRARGFIGPCAQSSRWRLPQQ